MELECQNHIYLTVVGVKTLTQMYGCMVTSVHVKYPTNNVEITSYMHVEGSNGIFEKTFTFSTWNFFEL